MSIENQLDMASPDLSRRSPTPPYRLRSRTRPITQHSRHHGHAEADDEQPAISRFGPAGCALLTEDAGQLAARAYLRHVVDSLIDGVPPDCTITDSRHTLTIIDAAYRSARTGRTVTCDDD